MKSLHRGAFTERRVYTEKSLPQRSFCTQNLVHTDAFTHRGGFTNRQLYYAQNFYIEQLLSSEACTHGAAFLHRSLYIWFFPTFQVRVARFYQSSPPPPPSPPPSPPPPLPPLPCPLPPCQLFAKLFANFRTQWALLDLNCKGLSALGTAGPQPGTCRVQ